MHESISEWWKKICRPTASFKEGWTLLTGTIVILSKCFFLGGKTWGLNFSKLKKTSSRVTFLFEQFIWRMQKCNLNWICLKLFGLPITKNIIFIMLWFLKHINKYNQKCANLKPNAQFFFLVKKKVLKSSLALCLLLPCKNKLGSISWKRRSVTCQNIKQSS